MNSLLEDYLSVLARQLRILPKARRDDELREVRQHLIKLAEANREQCGTADEATEAAIRHFGPPKKVGRQMARAWWRGRCRPLWESVVMTAITAGFLLYLPAALVRVLFPPHAIAPGVVVEHVVSRELNIVCYIVIGGYVGWRLSQRTAGTAVGTALSTAMLGNVLTPFLIWQGLSLPQFTLAWLSPPFVQHLPSFLLWTWGFSTPFVLAAAVLSRSLARRRYA